MALCAADPEQRPLSLAGWVQDVRHAVVSQRQDAQDVQDAVPPFRPRQAAAPRGARGDRGVLVLAALAVVGVKLLGDNTGDDRDAAGTARTGREATGQRARPLPRPDRFRGRGGAAHRDGFPPPPGVAPGVKRPTYRVAPVKDLGGFEVGPAKINTKQYGPVPAGAQLQDFDARGVRPRPRWKSLDQAAGVDDGSPKRRAGSTSRWTVRPWAFSELAELGKPNTHAVDVSGRPSAPIEVDPGCDLRDGRSSLGAPSLKQ